MRMRSKKRIDVQRHTRIVYSETGRWRILLSARSAEVGGGYCSFAWKVPHFSQTFIIRGRLRITWDQISSPPHWHVPTLFRAAPWRATFCTLLSAISSRSFPLPWAA